MSLKSKAYNFGLDAENITVEYFKSLGFEVLARRYKTKYGEIDLIVQKNQSIIFVEVKARNKNLAVENLISKRQVLRIYSSAEFFLSEFSKYQSYECRIDLIGILKNNIV